MTANGNPWARKWKDPKVINDLYPKIVPALHELDLLRIDEKTWPQLKAWALKQTRTNCPWYTWQIAQILLGRDNP